jgi:hypothetical protein
MGYQILCLPSKTNYLEILRKNMVRKSNQLLPSWPTNFVPTFKKTSLKISEKKIMRKNLQTN